MATWNGLTIDSESAAGIRGEDLIARMADGDRPAFALFYDLYAPRMLGSLLRGLSTGPTPRTCCRKPSITSGDPPFNIRPSDLPRKFG